MRTLYDPSGVVERVARGYSPRIRLGWLVSVAWFELVGLGLFVSDSWFAWGWLHLIGLGCVDFYGLVALGWIGLDCLFENSLRNVHFLIVWYMELLLDSTMLKKSFILKASSIMHFYYFHR